MQKEPPASSRLCQHTWRPRAQTLPERSVVAAEDAGGDLELLRRKTTVVVLAVSFAYVM